jgi:uncharacterized protein
MDSIDALINQVPHDARVLDVRIGLRWTIVTVERDGQQAAGISATVQRTPHHTTTPSMPLAGQLATRSGLELAALIRSDNPLESGVGMAAINALLEVDAARCRDLNAGDIIIRRGAGKKVVIVGHFPFIDDARAAADTLWVLEQNPRDGDLPADRAPDVVPQADVVALTGMTLVNHTFDDLIALCRPDALVLVLGGSTPLALILFDYGVDIVAGTLIVDIPAAATAISQGAGFRQIPGKRLLALEREG